MTFSNLQRVRSPFKADLDWLNRRSRSVGSVRLGLIEYEVIVPADQNSSREEVRSGASRGLIYQVGYDALELKKGEPYELLQGEPTKSST